MTTPPYQQQAQAAQPSAPPQPPQQAPQPQGVPGAPGMPPAAPQQAPHQPGQQPHQPGMQPQQPGMQAPQPGMPGGAPGMQGAPQQSYAAAPAGYTSPIPIRRTHLGHAIASEWTKIKSVRSTIWTLSVMAALVIGIGLLVASGTKDSDYSNTPTTIPGLFGTLLGQLCIVTLGVLVVSSEYGTGMIRTTFTASPQRSRVLTAKALVFFLVSFLTTTAALAFVAFASAGMHSGPEVMEPTGKQLLGATVGAGLYVSLLGLLSLAVGSMLRHSAGAITAMLGVVLLPAILPAFLMMSSSLQTLGEKMQKYSSPNSLAALFQIDDELGTGWSQLGLLAGVTAAAFIAAYALLEKRDV
ncbi:putative ABC transporter integral membrane subunit [Streptomyces bingchenggensis BCW-1]|uniref:Putative ABC transporter integral membrane subunit n=1 Tax=Streptomyces bingchenggensis (strain BCW-1) TaxID=749414 RepID=D7CFX2_STRBB|nr:ABC transporter permease [Streptomyces bingchenggensis]ADI06880.1 putative ABC transporter integral membrane subunit [Streptomyces bingchenggensis BCW-1]